MLSLCVCLCGIVLVLTSNARSCSAVRTAVLGPDACTRPIVSSLAWRICGLRISSSWSQRALAEHVAFQHVEASDGHPKGGVAVSVERKNGPQTFNGTEILAM